MEPHERIPHDDWADQDLLTRGEAAERLVAEIDEVSAKLSARGAADVILEKRLEALKAAHKLLITDAQRPRSSTTWQAENSRRHDIALNLRCPPVDSRRPRPDIDVPLQAFGEQRIAGAEVHHRMTEHLIGARHQQLVDRPLRARKRSVLPLRQRSMHLDLKSS